MGFATKTYDFNMPSFCPLQGAALRTALKTTGDEWKIDTTSYTANYADIPPGLFRAFASYTYVSKKPGQKPVGANCARPPPRAISTASSGVSGVDPRVEDWVERVERARKKGSKTEDDAYSQDDQTGASQPSGFSSPELKEDIETTEEPYNLMDSLDPVPPLPDHKPLIFSGDRIADDPEDQDKVYPTNELALFGIEEDQPKELRDTMKQKARRRKTPSCQTVPNVGNLGKLLSLFTPCRTKSEPAARSETRNPIHKGPLTTSWHASRPR